MRKIFEWGKDWVLTRWLNVPVGGAIEVGDVRITGLRPLGGGQKKGITKAGRLSMSGDLNGVKVKVYSVHSGAQAALRRELDRISMCGCRFPRVMASNDWLVAEEWIEGEPVNALGREGRMAVAESVDEFLEFSSRDVHVRAIAEKWNGAFCYLDDYLVGRLGPWVHWEPVVEFLDAWRESRRRVMDEVESRLSHPDLSVHNLLVQRGSSSVFVVDNELLGVGQGWVVDRMNAARGGLDVPRPQGGGADFVRFIDNTWRLRLIGSALDAGKIARACRLAKGVDWPE